MTVLAGFLLMAAAPAGAFAGEKTGHETGGTTARVVSVSDPDRDAEGDDRVRRLSELTGVRYVLRPGAARLTIAARFARLERRGAAAGGAVSQHIGVLISTSRGCQDSWIVSATNAGRADVTYSDPCDDEYRRVRPELLAVSGEYGEGGVLRVRVSTELFENRRVELRTVAQVGDGRAWDFTRFTRARRLG